ncbi:unnamed protein product [Lepeophtheirus salmonis]|uniref:(salmon louse) hypothetical protein n=1 Tax=Lepeophtheirus salmonis TaxID=72036 RepID=A0A7R8H933_LEPSM|nr:unnamed protein product [Lepeophtheirus salmonis]CAF2942235.1 unnamed protein product [Lepeophtheirus salmonis]
MFRDINSLGLNSVSDLDDGTIGSFEDMKNRVHDIMVDYFESKTPVDGIKNNQNMSNLIAMAEFISDVSKSYVNKVYPYVEEGLIMTPRIGDTSKHLEKLKEVNFLNNSWCQDKVKCTEVRELISQASNLESLWPSQSMLESLTERPNESINILSKNFAKMSHVASRINETFKKFWRTFNLINWSPN